MNIRKILLIIVALTITPTAIAINKLEGTIEMIEASNSNGDCYGKIVTPTRARGFRWVCTYSAGSILLSLLQTAYSTHENVAIAVGEDVEYSPLYRVQIRHKCLSNPAYCDYPSR
ncbi:hypothetical protein EAE91_16165 [Photorhabdus noenieputensis]|uniref:Uncharacterized protein n=1 Tax=Photorhabdus australis subsp. thailandensis TaxID=2805096 RepID=A0A1C0U2D7_9GAMM|nr:hypothetical protein [Photorhabdus noenieputensis]OCQ52078.1 hypothetical protein Ppb6_02708 [Photorhabdus australis subsp. thailandensis]